MISLNSAWHFQVCIGVSANTFLLFFYISIILDHSSKPTDLVSCHLTFIHIVMILTSVVIWPPGMFELLKLGDDLKCKAFIYTNRVMRGLSICTTCHLSMFQAVTISPNTSWLAQFKQKLKNYMIHVFFYIWSLNLSITSNRIFYTGAYTNVTWISQLRVGEYCSLFPMSAIVRGLILMLTMARDVLLVGVMLASSAYMVVLLFRHQRRLHHLHGTSPSPRISPEKRATQTILLLVTFFVVMYWVDFIISSVSILLWVYEPVILNVQAFVLYAYPTITPLVQISSDKRIINMLQNMQSKCHQILKTYR